MAKETEIGTMIREGKSDEAMAKLVRLLRKHGGNTVHSAEEVGVHHATLKRWVVNLETAGKPIREALEEIRVAAAQKLAKPKVVRARKSA
jgi:transposase-like protein